MNSPDTPHVPPRSESVGSLRLFIAIEVPPHVREQIERLSRNLQKGVAFTGAHPTWVKTEAMHLTLAFIGQRPPAWVDAAIPAMDRLGPMYAPMRIELKRLGVFPNWRQPRVLWMGVRERTHQLEGLRRELELSLTHLDYEPDPKPFHPHLTLARFRALRGTAAVQKVVEDHQDFLFGPFTAGELVMFRSELIPAGPVHTPLHRTPLMATAPHRVEVQQ